MLTAKIDLMKKLENPGLDHLKIVDAQVTCEECREMATWALIARWPPRMSTSLAIPTMVFVLIKASMVGGRNPVSRLTTANKVVCGRTSTEVNLLMRTSILRLQSFLPWRYLALSHDHEHNN
jgi:hypothetical protein